MPKKNPFVTTLEGVAKRLAKVKPTKALEVLDEAFLVFAAAGDVAHASAVVRLAYGGALPLPAENHHAFGTGPMDAWCTVAKLGDLTKGVPRAAHLATPMPLAARVRASELMLRRRLTDEDSGNRKPTGKWKTLEGAALLREVQRLARPSKDGALPQTEREALEAVTKYMDAWCDDPEDRGARYGEEVALAFDLALRHGAKDRVARWVPVLGTHLLASYVGDALCLPALAAAIRDGLLAPVVALPKEQAQTAFSAIDRAASELAGSEAKSAATSPPKAATRAGKAARSRRKIHAEYSQFYVEHAGSPKKEVFFQDRRESAQGMSIFATKVGIATPGDTGDCVVEIALAPASAKGKPTGPATLAEAVQAVCFPFVVQGPLFVKSVSGGDDDEDRDVILPHGAYDVLARFLPRRAAKADAEAGLRSFTITLDFHPAGALGAPRCFKLEAGKPPAKIFVNG